MGRRVIFGLPWPLTKPLLPDPRSYRELPQAPSLHSTSPYSILHSPAKDCYIRRWLTRLSDCTAYPAARCDSSVARGLLPDADASIARRLANDLLTDLRDCNNLAMLLSHMAFVSEGFGSGAVSRGGGARQMRGRPCKGGRS
jgi:hypothetical protein